MVQHIALWLQKQHVLICTDNKVKAASINHQGRVHSAQFLSTARQLLCWVNTHTLSTEGWTPYKVRVLTQRTDPSDLDWARFPSNGTMICKIDILLY